jgi:hypothetical protein
MEIYSRYENLEFADGAGVSYVSFLRVLLRCSPDRYARRSKASVYADESE